MKTYEKVQCYAYMYILDIDNVHLSETLKNNNENQNMNIICINYKQDYMDNILEK